MDANVESAVRAKEPVFADDLLRGADAIAEFLFGDRNYRRKVYHLAETTKIPVFRLGSLLCARKSVLLHWVAEQEKRGWNSPPRDSKARDDQDEDVEA